MSYQVPQTRIFTQFEASNAISTSALAACVVAPYYDVHADIAFGKYPDTKEFPYIGLSGDDRITSADITDKVFTTIIKNAQVLGYNPIPYQSTTEGDAGYVNTAQRSLATGLVVAEGGGFSVPEGFPALKVGDIVTQTASGGTSPKKIFKIAGFMQADATSYGIGLPKFETAGEHNTTDITLEGTHDLAYNAVMTIRITTGGTVTAEDSPVKAAISLNDGAIILSNFTCDPTGGTLTDI